MGTLKSVPIIVFEYFLIAASRVILFMLGA